MSRAVKVILLKVEDDVEVVPHLLVYAGVEVDLIAAGRYLPLRSDDEKNNEATLLKIVCCGNCIKQLV